MESVCCLLHNLIAGGAARQWLHLLGKHVEEGGRATIVAPSGPLTPRVRAAGIETVEADWQQELDSNPLAMGAIAAHDVAVVEWNHHVMNAFDAVLTSCGRAALVVHQSPTALSRWLGSGIVEETRLPLERAIADPHGVVLVRGPWHRQRIAAGFDLDPAVLRILPPAIPPPPFEFEPAPAEPERVLALTRLTSEKAAIVDLAAELVRARLARGLPSRLSVAGDGAWRGLAAVHCEDRLPAGAWEIEGPPKEPLARLASADLVVAQGQTTLEAAQLGRRVIVARNGLGRRPAGIVLTPARYDLAARDPFGRLPVSPDPELLLREAIAVSDEELLTLRNRVGRYNGLEAGSRALAEAFASIA